jgi:N-formylglutamate amidohydrolase
VTPHVTPLPEPLVHRQRCELPVLLSVPHSGRDYPGWLVARSAHGRGSLVSLEDPLVDRLVWPAIERGFAAVIARAPRAAVDCNRAEDDVDPSVVEGTRPRRISARARGGLGIVPGRTHHHGNLWRQPIPAEDLEQRLVQAHRPYHGAIERQLADILQRFGCALLIDCHSMPAPPPGVPPIVFGDCHGRSASSWVSAEALRIARAAGFSAGLNEPFAGGHIVERHGGPRRDVHALQIEIDRRCYLNEKLDGPGGGFDCIAGLFTTLAVGLGEYLLNRQIATAAE